MQRSRIASYTQGGEEELLTKKRYIVFQAYWLPEKNGFLLLYKQAPFGTCEENCYWV